MTTRKKRGTQYNWCYWEPAFSAEGFEIISQDRERRSSITLHMLADSVSMADATVQNQTAPYCEGGSVCLMYTV